MATYFTPPYRSFMPEADPDLPQTMQQPWLSMKATVPRPINLWKRDDLDGLLHEGQPATYNVNSKMFAGGHQYGPLDQTDIDLITNSGYGAYLHASPTPPELIVGP